MKSNCPICGRYAELYMCLDFHVPNYGDYMVGNCGSCPPEKVETFCKEVKEKYATKA